MGKTRPSDQPYEVWEAGDWTWKVRKFNQADRTQPYATAFCEVSSPFTHGSADLGDTYIADFERVARLVSTDYPAGVEYPNGVRHPKPLTDIPDEV